MRHDYNEMQVQSLLEMLKQRYLVLRNSISVKESKGWRWITFNKITQIFHKSWEQTEVFSSNHTEMVTVKVLYCMTTKNGLWVDSSPYFICM